MSRRKRSPTPTREPPLSNAEAQVQVAKINRSSAIAVACLKYTIPSLIAAGAGLLAFLNGG